MTRSEILATADRLISTDRHGVYGPAAESFGRIAALWSADLGIPISPVDVARLLALFKIARARGGVPHPDNWIDLAGYAALAGELENEHERNPDA